MTAKEAAESAAATATAEAKKAPPNSLQIEAKAPGDKVEIGGVNIRAQGVDTGDKIKMTRHEPPTGRNGDGTDNPAELSWMKRVYGTDDREEIAEIWKALVPPINPHYQFEAELTNNVTADIVEGRPYALTGHAGTGKTSLPQQLAARLNVPCLSLNLNGMAMASDLIGKQIAKARVITGEGLTPTVVGETTWAEGALLMCMKRGWHLNISEFDYAEATMVSPLNPVLDHPIGTIIVKEHDGEVVRPHPRFRLNIDGNTLGVMEKFRHLYPGTKNMNWALKDRVNMYLITYLKDTLEAQVVANAVPRMNIKLAVPMVAVANQIRSAFEKEEIKSPFGTRMLINWAAMTIRVKHPIKAAEPTIYNKISVEDREVIEGLIRRKLVDKKP